MIPRDVGMAIRGIRKVRGLTPRELADKLGVKVQQVYQYESAYGYQATYPSLLTLTKIAVALEVPAWRILKIASHRSDVPIPIAVVAVEII